ncbi:hypothetical protein SGQ44_11320 [Flavobacterium sp. Fl-77]|uniref:Uncharacterized protein n=1 Tax=Flavobacterium flavipigmentatum TaxID=2893884 RepID=A0AAJ2SHX8_9FLAO|nr:MULTISPECIES: hypothetical protein [unclassified Flavobacterium]MDX6182900.1 hypothetical protein [Flavobacterium sp. Fl-33]MDX6186353.1 hypothetical protein [Flavobacterium sp. Fl-77]UFH37859.1 hypothetical protein LNP22_14080 [Flavobacterium sp. F-70]
MKKFLILLLVLVPFWCFSDNPPPPGLPDEPPPPLPVDSMISVLFIGGIILGTYIISKKR